MKTLKETLNPLTKCREVTLVKDGTSKTVPVHQLVAEAFLGPCPKGKVVCHGPGGPEDNSASNLFYGDPSENHPDLL
jgi:hypothetical protein